jgi:TolB protein
MALATVAVVLPATLAGAPEALAGVPGPARIAFTRWDGRDTDVLTMAQDGSDELALTDNRRDEFSPAWSPNRDSIAFVRYAKDGVNAVFVVDADGSNVRRLTPTGMWATEPAWHPDGDALLFAGGPEDERWDIWTVAVSGSTPPERITETPGLEESAPAWSPDGTHIAFTRRRRALASLAVADQDGGDRTRITGRSLDVESYGGIDWSPDGSRIVFGGLGDDDPAMEIYVVAPDGSDLRALTNNGHGDLAPSWSPDGNEIVWQCEVGGYEICRRDVEIPGRTVLSDNGVDEEHPDW